MRSDIPVAVVLARTCREPAMTETLNAGEVCSRIVTIAERGMAVDEAARLMREHHVGCLIVVDETPQGRMPVGILTDRDIVTSIVAKDVDTTFLCLEDVMVRDLVTARESDSLMDLLGLMRRKGVRRLPVLGAKGELVGLVTLDDVLDVLAQQFSALAAAIESEQRRERELRR